MLAQCPMFRSATPEELARIGAMSRAMDVRAGEFVFREGATCDGFYIVVSGSVRVFKIGPDGRERILHIARPPQSFAEAAMFGRATYPAFAAAMEDSRLILIRRDPFLRMLRENPDTAMRMFEAMSMWMRRLLDQLENETFLNARAKLTNFLLREARADPAQPASVVELTQPKKDIASHLGMAPETLSRGLADLEARGLIRVAARRVELVDVEALERLLFNHEDS